MYLANHFKVTKAVQVVILKFTFLVIYTEEVDDKITEETFSRQCVYLYLKVYAHFDEYVFQLNVIAQFRIIQEQCTCNLLERNQTFFELNGIKPHDCYDLPAR